MYPATILDYPRSEANETCPECYSMDVIVDYSRGERICSHCGLILDSHLIDPNAEWRHFSYFDSAQKSRVGSPELVTLHDKGLSTLIDGRDVDGFGHKLSPRAKSDAYRLRKWHNRMRIHSSRDRNLAFAMSELERISSQMHLNRLVKESAAIFYRKSVQLNIIKGRSIESMICAAIYAACRLSNLPKTLENFLQYSNLQKRDLGRSYRCMIQRLQLRIPNITPTKFVAQFAQDLDISPESQFHALRILRIANKIGLTSGKDPSSLAAASIYVAALRNGEHKTQKEIADVAQITEVTVRNRYKELVKNLHL